MQVFFRSLSIFLLLFTLASTSLAGEWRRGKVITINVHTLSSGVPKDYIAIKISSQPDGCNFGFVSREETLVYSNVLTSLTHDKNVDVFWTPEVRSPWAQDVCRIDVVGLIK